MTGLLRGGLRDRADDLVPHGDARMRLDALGHRLREDVAIDGERAARGDLRDLGRRHDERAAATQLLLQETDRVDERGAAHRVRADELAEAVGVLRRRARVWLLLDELDVDPALGELKRGLAPREPGADDNDLHAAHRLALRCHVDKLGFRRS